MNWKKTYDKDNFVRYNCQDKPRTIDSLSVREATRNLTGNVTDGDVRSLILETDTRAKFVT